MIRVLILGMGLALAAPAQDGKTVWNEQEKPIMDQMKKLRGMPDDERVTTTKRLAMQIRELPAGAHKLSLAETLSHLVTEGDPGAETLQAVATTLAQAVAEQPGTGKDRDEIYSGLAQLVRYEHVKLEISDPRFQAAMAKLEEDDRARQNVDFTLRDLHGKSWTLKKLRGRVVLVNFWATWCPPCRKEMPDMRALYERLRGKGLVVLGISDEDAAKVKTYIAAHPVGYPILLDPGRKVNELFRVAGIPKNFLFDREGKLVAEAIDMRTRRQFSEMLEKAGI